ncbi:hypothetical protein C8R45DRAFT_928482 [Mycena sanguinolenta]|nr:hypothetical protein C8R45DRAFT_928482 [Mycena sanguinolenta]
MLLAAFVSSLAFCVTRTCFPVADVSAPLYAKSHSHFLTFCFETSIGSVVSEAADVPLPLPSILQFEVFFYTCVLHRQQSLYCCQFVAAVDVQNLKKYVTEFLCFSTKLKEDPISVEVPKARTEKFPFWANFDSRDRFARNSLSLGQIELKPG